MKWLENFTESAPNHTTTALKFEVASPFLDRLIVSMYFRGVI
jgi:hypothetical protein